MFESAELPLVVAVGGDPGGANALAPVLETLRADGCTEIQAGAYRHALEVWQRRGQPFRTLSEEAAPVLPERTSLLITSTSVNGLDLEKQYIIAARARGIPTLAVLDYWANYRERFDAADGSLPALPDLVAVMDERAREDMVAAGIDAERIVVTGQPAFDELARHRAEFTQARRDSVREKLGVGSDETLVVFLSQPYSKFYGIDDSHPDFAGFDERSVLAALLSALENAAQDDGRKMTLVVRPHPREDPENFAAFRSQHLRLLVTTDGEPRDLVLAADLTTGMNTILLVEACYLGCVVVSLQPGLRGPDPIPTNLLGLSLPIYSEREIAPCIRELLFDTAARRAMEERIVHFQPPGDASRRVADLAYKLLQLRPSSSLP